MGNKKNSVHKVEILNVYVGEQTSKLFKKTDLSSFDSLFLSIYLCDHFFNSHTFKESSVQPLPNKK